MLGKSMVEPLHQPVLVLNRYWQPVHSCTARRAIKLLWLGRAQVVAGEAGRGYDLYDLKAWLARPGDEGGEGLSLKCPRGSFGIPEVIALTGYDRVPRKMVRLNRRNVFVRDAYTCQYCARVFHERDLNLDHVRPRNAGGKMTWDNIVTSCIRCNSRKGCKLPEEANMHPLRKPQAPGWSPIYGRAPAFESWTHFTSRRSA